MLKEIETLNSVIQGFENLKAKHKLELDVKDKQLHDLKAKFEEDNRSVDSNWGCIECEKYSEKVEALEKEAKEVSESLS